MSAFSLTLDGSPIDLPTLDACHGRPLNVTVTPESDARLERARRWVDALLAGDTAVYGVNTGFGHLRRTRIKPADLEQLQENLVVSHAVGVGPSTPAQIVRWMLLFKTHMLLIGHSGVRKETVDLLCQLLNEDLLPEVPTRGSLGTSGDLAPLAHLVLPLIGRGKLATNDGVKPTAEVFAQRGWRPVRLAAKEGLALINGTQFMSAYAADIGVRAHRLADLADLIACLSLEGLCGSVRPFDERIHALRPHAAALCRLLARSCRPEQLAYLLPAHPHEMRDLIDDQTALNRVDGASTEALRNQTHEVQDRLLTLHVGGVRIEFLLRPKPPEF